MTHLKSVTNMPKSVTRGRDSLARAGTLRVESRCHGVTPKRDVTLSKRDTSACRPSVTRAAPSIAKKPMTWMHVAALNLIADHDAGIAVNPIKLEAARKLIAA